MALGKPIQIRLEEEQQLYFEEMAAIHKTHLSTFIRDFLTKKIEEIEKEEALKQEIRAGFFEIKNMISSKNKSGEEIEKKEITPPINESTLMELLLLIRTIAGPERLKFVHGELKRQNFVIWNGKD